MDILETDDTFIGKIKTFFFSSSNKFGKCFGIQYVWGAIELQCIFLELAKALYRKICQDGQGVPLWFT